MRTRLRRVLIRLGTYRMSATYAHRMRNPRSHAPIMHVLAAAGIGVQCEKVAPSPENVARATQVVDEEQWMEERRLSLARIRERKLARRLGVALPDADEAEEHQVALPKIEPPGKLTRSDSIVEEEEEEKGMEGDLLPVALPAVKTESTTCQPSQEDTLATSEDGETETATLDSPSLGSDRTKVEGVEPHTLRDKVILDLEDSNTLAVVSL